MRIVVETPVGREQAAGGLSELTARDARGASLTVKAEGGIAWEVSLTAAEIHRLHSAVTVAQNSDTP